MLRRLESLVSVAELGSLTAAAQRLHLTQPALTKQLQSLEQELGLTLLERGARGVRLTPAAVRLLPLARTAVGASGALVRTAAELRRPEQAHLRLGVGQSLVATFLPPLLQAFRPQFPDARVEVVVGVSGHLMRYLRNYQVDLALFARREETAAADLRLTRLVDDPLVFAFPPDHAWNGTAAQPLAAVADQPLITLSQASGLWRDLSEAMAERELVPASLLEVDSHEAMLELVAVGVGIAVVPQAEAAHYQERGLIGTALVLDWPPNGRTLYLAERLDLPSAAVQFFGRMVRHRYRNQGPGGTPTPQDQA